MSNIHSVCLVSAPPDRSVAADLLLRQEPDGEGEEEEDDGKEDDEDGEEEDDGYSE
jgi:hypothetical protein